MRYLINGLSAVYFICLNRIIRLFTHVKGNKVLFISDVRREIGGNLKDVYDELDESYDKVTYMKADRRNVSGFLTFLRFVYNITTARYILLEDYFRYISYIKLQDTQEISQLWHAAGAYKKFGYSRLEGNEGIKIHSGYKKYSKAIVSADSIKECYAEAFGITIDKVKATGVPRTDIFFDQNYVAQKKEEIYTEFPEFRKKKVILFAPTYRGLRAEEAAYDFSKIKLPKFYEELKDDYVFIFKWHPAVYNNILRQNAEVYQLEQYQKFYYDLSQERDINDLLLVTDIMITDYSSVIFDYLLVDKPIIYYTYDLDLYAGGRGMYYEFEDYLYGPVVKEQDELIKAIKTADYMPEKREEFRRRFMEACDGNATKKTCDWIFSRRSKNGNNY